MQVLYNILTHTTKAVLCPSQFFSKKMRFFVEGRKNALLLLQAALKPEDTTIWFHCASLGEFEQGLPIMQALKKAKPGYKLAVTFFSPSGFEIKKNTPLADAISYLPYDTPQNVAKFLEIVHPSMAFFVKYDFWPNYLKALNGRKIPTFLISGLFRKEQLFFKKYGSFMREALSCFDHFFIQNEASKELLASIGFNNVTVSGDTRFDRVSHQIEMNNTLDFMEHFKGNAICIACGSTWPEDEAVLLPYINEKSGSNVKFVVAPHSIDVHKIESFRKKLKPSSVQYSESNPEKLKQAQVLIVDTVGFLSKIYSYADVAYVGGAMGHTGLHNILEAATFGVPIVIGSNYQKFPEAIKLEDLAGLYTIQNAKECMDVMEKFVNDKKFREQTGMIAGHFVNKNTGATQLVMSFLEKRGLV